MRASVLLSVLILLAAPPMARAARSRCKLDVEAEGIAEKPEHSKSCTDGDPACDAAPSADGVCEYRARLCLMTASKAACAPEDVARVIVTPGPGLEGLADVLGRFKATPTADACTEHSLVQVKTRGKKMGRTVLRALTPGGRERYTFVCRPHKGGPPPATFDDIQRKIFDTTCATPSCHGAGAASAGLDLSAGAAYANLVNVPPSNEVAAAAGWMRVIPGDPGGSFLMYKLTGDLEAGKGSRMPLVGAPLPQSAIDLIRNWIASGAPETAPF